MTTVEVPHLTQDSEPGVYEMTTATGSRYEIVINPDQSSTSARIPATDGLPLRHDNEVWHLKGRMFAAVGYPAVFELEGMGDPELTIRRTSHVKELVKVS
jgi:hypothetical protein